MGRCLAAFAMVLLASGCEEQATTPEEMTDGRGPTQVVAGPWSEFVQRSVVQGTGSGTGQGSPALTGDPAGLADEIFVKNGLEWVWASPCDGSCSQLIEPIPYGFRLPTVAEWDNGNGKPTLAEFGNGAKCASRFFDNRYTHCDSGDYNGGYVVGPAYPYRRNWETVLVRGASDNDPPVVAADGDATTSEGSSATNTGTVSDPNGNSVTLSASVGVVTDNENGTWSWSYVTTDGPAESQTVTVTASSGPAQAQTTFELTVNNVAPDVDAGTDETITGGATASRAGSFADPGADTWTATVDYGTGGGAGALPLTGQAFSLSHTYPMSGSYTTTVTVTDSDGAVGTASFDVMVDNTLPTVDAGSGGTVDEGSPFTSSGSFSDPDTDSWSATVDYGDDSGVSALGLSGSTFSLEHTYADDGSYTVTVAVEDGTGSASGTATVTVNNVAPTLTLDAMSTVPTGDASTGTATISDPGADEWDINVDYGDGVAIETTRVPEGAFGLSHSYAEDGTYTVTVTVDDRDGGVTTATTTATITNRPSLANAGAGQVIESPNDGTTLSVTLDGSGSSDPDGSVVSYSWSLNGSEIATGVNPTVAVGWGQHTITLTVTDNDGATSTSTVLIRLVDLTPPAATAALVPVESRRLKEDRGDFTVVITCTDSRVSGTTSTTATLNDYPVENGQRVRLHVTDTYRNPALPGSGGGGGRAGRRPEESERTERPQLLGPSFELVAVCSDEDGNEVVATAVAVFAERSRGRSGGG
jgi:PKD repeat protein